MVGKWNNERFFEAVEKSGMRQSQTLAVKRLHDFSKKNAVKMVGGRGKITGSINPRFAPIYDESIFTLRTNGRLRINYGLIIRQADGGKEFASLLSNKLSKYAGLEKLSSNVSYSNYPELKPEEWTPYVDEIIAFLAELIEAPSQGSKEC